MYMSAAHELHVRGEVGTDLQGGLGPALLGSCAHHLSSRSDGVEAFALSLRSLNLSVAKGTLGSLTVSIPQPYVMTWG